MGALQERPHPLNWRGPHRGEEAREKELKAHGRSRPGAPGFHPLREAARSSTSTLPRGYSVLKVSAGNERRSQSSAEADCSTAGSFSLQTREASSACEASSEVSEAERSVGSALTLGLHQEGYSAPHVVWRLPTEHGSAQVHHSHQSEHCGGRAKAAMGARETTAMTVNSGFISLRICAPFEGLRGKRLTDKRIPNPCRMPRHDTNPRTPRHRTERERFALSVHRPG